MNKKFSYLSYLPLALSIMLTTGCAKEESIDSAGLTSFEASNIEERTTYTFNDEKEEQAILHQLLVDATTTGKRFRILRNSNSFIVTVQTHQLKDSRPPDFQTKDQAEFEAWMLKMEEENQLIEYEYDKETGLFKGWILEKP